MSTETKAKEAIAQIDRAMKLLDDPQFDIASYLLSMAKLALLEVVYPDEFYVKHISRRIAATEFDDVLIPLKKH